VLKWVFGNNRSEKAAHQAPPYEVARDEAANGSIDERTRLARCEDLPPEFLYYFATDKDPGVRAAVAHNIGTPLQADILLAKDREASVRSALAKKIAKILPNIRPDQSEKLAELAFEVLEILAEDQAVQVRKIIAESIKSLDNVPKPIVQLLARDLEDSVSMPVLEFSPLLEEQDLLNLILTGISSKRLAAVSRREDLTVELIDTIVKTHDDIAVEALIENEKANIPKKTMDKIVDASTSRERWQFALASRKSIPADTLFRLSRFATEAVLKRLRTRSDLGEELHAELQTAVEHRVEETFEQPISMNPEDMAYKKAKALKDADELSETRILSAISNNDRPFVDAALAVLAGQPMGDIRNLLKMQSAKSVLALTWKCGLSMKTALAIQEKILCLPFGKMLRPTAGGAYPMSDDDLSWQSELLFD
jgi:uncharacterized protein (DUF2336 family)